MSEYKDKTWFFFVKRTWVLMPAVSVNSCVNLNSSFGLSEVVSICQMGAGGLFKWWLSRFNNIVCQGRYLSGNTCVPGPRSKSSSSRNNTLEWLLSGYCNCLLPQAVSVLGQGFHRKFSEAWLKVLNHSKRWSVCISISRAGVHSGEWAWAAAQRVAGSVNFWKQLSQHCACSQGDTGWAWEGSLKQWGD